MGENHSMVELLGPTITEQPTSLELFLGTTLKAAAENTQLLAFRR